MFNRSVNLSMKNIFPLNSGANTSLPCKCIGSSDLLYVVWNGKKVRTLSFCHFHSLCELWGDVKRQSLGLFQFVTTYLFLVRLVQNKLKA